MEEQEAKNVGWIRWVSVAMALVAPSAVLLWCLCVIHQFEGENRGLWHALRWTANFTHSVFSNLVLAPIVVLIACRMASSVWESCKKPSHKVATCIVMVIGVMAGLTGAAFDGASSFIGRRVLPFEADVGLAAKARQTGEPTILEKEWSVRKAAENRPANEDPGKAANDYKRYTTDLEPKYAGTDSIGANVEIIIGGMEWPALIGRGLAMWGTAWAAFCVAAALAAKGLGIYWKVRAPARCLLSVVVPAHAASIMYAEFYSKFYCTEWTGIPYHGLWLLIPVGLIFASSEEAAGDSIWKSNALGTTNYLAVVGGMLGLTLTPKATGIFLGTQEWWVLLVMEGCAALYLVKQTREHLRVASDT